MRKPRAQWLRGGRRSDDGIARHLVGVTANPEAAVAYGIAADQVLRFWDWVGGRYSLWSSVGISIAVACGPDAFDALLDGAAAMDAHFRDAPLEHNLPAWLGLVSIWNRNGLGCASQAVIPYAERLRLLPSFLQQLIMESNGKSALLDGTKTDAADRAGDLGRHPAPTRSIRSSSSCTRGRTWCRWTSSSRGGRRSEPAPGDKRHDILLANCLAQSAALALGKPLPDADAGENWHKAFPGNRPSTTLLLPAVDAAVARCAARRLRACHLHRQRRPRHQRLRPVRRRIRQGDGDVDRGSPGRPRRSRHRPFHQGADRTDQDTARQ